MREMLDKYLGLLMYLSMINRDIIFVEFKWIFFNYAKNFNTNAHSCGDVSIIFLIFKSYKHLT